jgi:hypothetical protein
VSTDTPAAEPKWYDRPAVKKLIEIGVIVLLAWLATKGIKLPGETLPPTVVNVTYPEPHK